MPQYKKKHPRDIESNNKAIGILLPITLDNSNFLNQSYTTIDQIRTNLKNLILTEKGERLMLPDYGMNLKHKIFEVIKEGKQIDLEDEIRTSVKIWMPYVNIDVINITTDEHQININIKFSYLSNEDELNIILNVQ